MRILFIDDDEVFLAMMEGILHQKGYDIIKATDGKLAREALGGEKIDLIISDVFMPTLDGIRFHSFVREFTGLRDVPFIFISAHGDEHLRNLAVTSANDYFLRKPVPVEDILTLINTVMGTSTREDASR
jgi:DNA-binding response OmpR family regulator